MQNPWLFQVKEIGRALGIGCMIVQNFWLFQVRKGVWGEFLGVC